MPFTPVILVFFAVRRVVGMFGRIWSRSRVTSSSRRRPVEAAGRRSPGHATAGCGRAWRTRRGGASALVLMETLEAVQDVLEGTDLCGRQSARLQGRQRQVRHLGARVAVRQRRRVTGNHPRGEAGQAGQVGVHGGRSQSEPLDIGRLGA